MDQCDEHPPRDHDRTLEAQQVRENQVEEEEIANKKKKAQVRTNQPKAVARQSKSSMEAPTSGVMPHHDSLAVFLPSDDPTDNRVPPLVEFIIRELENRKLGPDTDQLYVHDYGVLDAVKKTLDKYRETKIPPECLKLGNSHLCMLLKMFFEQCVTEPLVTKVSRKHFLKAVDDKEYVDAICALPETFKQTLALVLYHLSRVALNTTSGDVSERRHDLKYEFHTIIMGIDLKEDRRHGYKHFNVKKLPSPKKGPPKHIQKSVKIDIEDSINPGVHREEVPEYVTYRLLQLSPTVWIDMIPTAITKEAYFKTWRYFS